MEILKLSEEEQKSYAELFQTCDVENTGRVTGTKASELLMSSGLPADVLYQITELCGAKRLGHFGRSQFYIALKLVAASQAGLPTKFDSFTSGKDLPLPKFPKYSMEQEGRRTLLQQAGMSQGLNQSQTDQDRSSGQCQSKSVGLPPPPSKMHVRTFSGAKVQTQAQTQMNISVEVGRQDIGQGQGQTTSPLIKGSSPPLSPRERPHKTEQVLNVSANTSETVPSQPTPGCSSSQQARVTANTANSGGDHPQTVSHIPTQNGVHSLQTVNSNNGDNESNRFGDEKVTWASFEEEDSQGLIAEVKKSEWNEPGSDLLKQTDTSSVTSSEAESEIDVWTISDEQRDYYVNQFKTMQSDLNGLILGATAKDFFEKSKLPVQELSKIWQLSDMNKDGALSLEEFCTAMHLVVLRRNDIELPDSLPPSLMPYTPLSGEPFASDLPPGSTLKRLTPTTPEQSDVNQMWSASGSSRSPPAAAPATALTSVPAQVVPSPNSKPVNFEFKPPNTESDSTIIHPVALRMSPEGQPISVDNLKSRTFSDPSAYESVLESQGQGQGQSDLSPTKPRSQTESFIDPGGDGALANKFSAPLHPRPRPTPKKAQAGAGAHIALPPPAVPPRTTPKDTPGHASPTQDTTHATAAVLQGLKTEDSTETPVTKQIDARVVTAEKRALQAAIRKQKERNTQLCRLNSELNQELQEVMEQRIALEIQLEHLRPFAS